MSDARWDDPRDTRDLSTHVPLVQALVLEFRAVAETFLMVANQSFVKNS